MVCKEKANKTAEHEENLANLGIKPIPASVFFISLVGSDPFGKVDDNEHIFDIYTKMYDFHATDVIAKSVQDLWEWQEEKNKGIDKSKIDVYTLVENFVMEHPNAHYVLDECPFLWHKVMGKFFSIIREVKFPFNVNYMYFNLPTL